MATTQAEVIADLQRTNAELRRERDVALALNRAYAARSIASIDVMKTIADSPDDTHGQWLTLSPDQTLGDAGGAGLAYGDWLLLFFDHAPEPDALPPAPAYPKTPADAQQALATLGVAAAIWSWLDDAEWLVAVRASV